MGDLKEFERQQKDALKAKLSDVDMRWLERSITWEAPDLRSVSVQLLRQLFPEPKHPERINDNRLLLTLIWQWWLLILMSEADPVRGNLRSFWYQVVEPFYREHRLLAPTEGFLELVGSFPTGVGELPTGVSDRSNRVARVVELMTENLGKFVWHRVFKFSGEFEFQRPMDHLSFVGKDDAKYLFFAEKEGLWWLCQMLYGDLGDGLQRSALVSQPGVFRARPGAPHQEALDRGLQRLRPVGLVDRHQPGAQAQLLHELCRSLLPDLTKPLHAPADRQRP